MIVAPLSILGVWEEEFQKFAAFPYALAVLSGSSAKKLDTLRHMIGTALQVVVVNYESAWRLEKALTAWHPDLIIADEGHKIKTHNIAASKAMHRMGREASYRLLLTGTVITNKAIDVFSQYKFLNPAIYGNSFYAFRNRYFDMVGYGNHTPVLKKSMESELTEKLHSISYRATKAECLDLPETTDTLRFLCPDPYGYALDDETFTLSQAGEHEVEREIGNTDSEPVYSLQGTISSGTIVLTTNGETLRVIGPLAADEVLVIDTGMVTAKVTDSAGNTLRNGLPCLEELNFPVLRRGVNKVEIAVEGSAVFTELHIQAKSRWR